MRICIGGKNNIAVDVCRYLKEYYSEIEVSVIPNKSDEGKDGFQRSLRKYAEENGVGIVSLKDVYDWDDLIFISTEFDRIISPDKFKTKELFNIHFSKLPKYKGCHTAAMPILNGENATGVTFHLMEVGIDTGDIIDQKSLIIEENDTCGSLYIKLIDLGTKVVIDNLDRVINHSYTSYPQPAAESTYYPRTDIDYSTTIIDYNRTAKQIDRQIRAYTFRAFQLPKYNGTPILATKITSTKSVEKPGTLVFENEESYQVASIDYDIVLYKDRLEEIIQYVKDGDLESIKSIKELKLYVKEHEKSHGWTLLMVSAYYNRFDIAKHLLSLGSDINARNNNGTTVIMYAKDGMLQFGNSKLFKLLLNKGANPFIRDFSGKNLFNYVDDQLIRRIISENIT